MITVMLFIAFPRLLSALLLLAPCIWGGCGYNSEYLWRTYGRMPPMHSLQELRTLPNELLLIAIVYYQGRIREEGMQLY